MKKCSSCGIEKDESEFYGKQSQCKPCYGERCRDYQARTHNNRTRHRARKQDILHYAGSSCILCGESLQPSIQLHHVNPNEKEWTFGGVSKWRKHEWEGGFWKEEVDKCVVVCANCHFAIHSGVIEVDESGISYNTDWSYLESISGD